MAHNRTALYRVSLLAICIVGAVILAAVLSDRKQSIQKKQTSIPEATCPGNAFRVGLPPLSEVASEVPVIVIASLEERTEDGALFRVQKILKGDQLSKGELIHVCPGFSAASGEQSFDSTLLLLNGRENDSERWAPEQLEFGVIPSSKNGFLIRSIHNKGKYYSADEIHKIIKEQK